MVEESIGRPRAECTPALCTGSLSSTSCEPSAILGRIVEGGAFVTRCSNPGGKEATMPSASDFEKLGVFYLGRPYDWQQKKAQDGLILYDSKDLVTHAVCVGMTGSGKTGLCLALIEEAALDGIPAILIDPKGDLANLLLTFPGLKPEDFRPWVNEDDARRKNLSVDDYARQQAELWQKGLASWGEDGARIQRLRDAADFAVYTPGSNAGIPLSILKSFAAPPPAIADPPPSGPPPAGRYRRRAVLMWVIQIASPVGFYAFASIAPIVLLAKGFDLTHSLMYSALTALGYPLGSLVSVYLTERVERRTLLIASTLAAAVFGVAFGLAADITVVVAAGIATSVSTVMQSNFTHIYQAELFHTTNRSTAIGIPYAASRLVGALLPLAALSLLAAIGSGGLYIGCAILLGASALAIRLLGPRTNNRQLDTI